MLRIKLLSFLPLIVVLFTSSLYAMEKHEKNPYASFTYRFAICSVPLNKIVDLAQISIPKEMSGEMMSKYKHVFFLSYMNEKIHKGFAFGPKNAIDIFGSESRFDDRKFEDKEVSCEYMYGTNKVDEFMIKNHDIKKSFDKLAEEKNYNIFLYNCQAAVMDIAWSQFDVKFEETAIYKNLSSKEKRILSKRHNNKVDSEEIVDTVVTGISSLAKYLVNDSDIDNKEGVVTLLNNFENLFSTWSVNQK